MSEFLEWHPSSKKAQKLYDFRLSLQKYIAKNPKKGITILREDWKFGEVSEIWDDFIFDNCVRPVLDTTQQIEIKDAICLYSVLDHVLFLPYVRREENPVRFRRAFWNINTYGIRIAQRFEQAYKPLVSKEPDNLFASSRKKIAFVLKGPYQLAHVEFLHNFLKVVHIFPICENLSHFDRRFAKRAIKFRSCINNKL